MILKFIKLSKPVWELDPESLRDLLKEGNPVGHLNFKFRVPSHHGYDFIPAYEGMYSACSKTHEGQNKAIDNYLECHDKTAVIRLGMFWQKKIILTKRHHQILKSIIRYF